MGNRVMKMLFGSFVAVLVLCSGIAMANEANNSAQSLLKLKVGSCKFTLLDENGVKPVADTMLSLVSAKDGKAVAKTASDRTGLCVLNIPKGRHILRINDRNLAVVESTVASKINECRILVSKDALVVGGAEGEGVATGTGTDVAGAGFATQQVVIGGLAVLTVAGGGYAVYDNNKSDSNKKPAPASN